ncbi:MAG: glycerophosphodiester phosphodiesterase [Acidimicrobiales bacterium]
MPRAEDFAYLDWPGPIAFAHRGGASEAPENTLPAFERAVQLGYRYLETDVHATADGVLLAFHDHVLDRVTDRTGVIAELPYSVVRAAKVDGIEPIPRFEELLASFPDARVNVDAKHDRAVGPLVAAVRRCQALHRVCISAFNDARIARARRALPGVCTSMGPTQIARLVAAAHGIPAGRFGAPCAQVPPAQSGFALVTSRLVAAAHRRGVQVHVWTIDDEAEMTRLLDLGVDGIMTDRPAVLRNVLERRDQWVA